MNAMKLFWARHVQKTIASVLGVLAAVDLTPYEQDVHEFIPWKHWHAAIRLAGAAAIFWRATQGSNLPPPPSQPPET